jgi:hypothetical protein
MDNNLKKIKELQDNQGSIEDLMLTLKTQTKLIEIRGNIAKELNTVIIR